MSTGLVTPSDPARFQGTYRHTTSSGGRLALRHPNTSPVSPHIGPVATKVALALHALSRWNGAPQIQGQDLPPEALGDLVRAFELLHDVDRELPRVWGFECGYSWAFDESDCWSGFSAHQSIVDATRWLAEWDRKLPRPWEIRWQPCRVADFRAPGLDPADWIRKD